MKEKYLSTKIEIKFAVEAMTQCGANCVGCFLTPELKLAQNFWRKEQFDKAKRFIRSSIVSLQNQGLSVDEVALNLGQGDYFQLDEEDIKNAVDFIYDCADGKASAFITASGVTNQEKLKKSVDFFHKYSIEKNQALLVDFVLDASKLSSPKMLEVYTKNITYIRSKFGHLDINLNINEDTVNNFTPEIINNFMINNDLNYLVINIVPAFHNKTPSQKSWNKIISWLNELYQIWDKKNYDLNFPDSIKLIQTAYPEKYNLFKAVQQGVKKIMTRGYVIDNDGNIYTQQTGFGDLPLSARNGFLPISNLDIPYSFEEIENNVNKICIEIIKEQTKNPCKSCEHQNVCSAIGTFAFKKVLYAPGTEYIAPNKEHCPVNLRNLLDLIKANDEKNNIEHCYGSEVGIFTQNGLKECAVKTKKIQYSDKEIVIK